MIAIAAVDRNWGIGYKDNLLERIPEDMKHFVNKTKGQVIVLGRKTLDSFKDGKPLKDRVNVVLTRQKDFKREDCIIYHNIEELIAFLKPYPGEIFICGGGEVYKALLPYCDKAYITKIDSEYKADTFFENLDIDNNWKMTFESQWNLSLKGTKFKFTEYDRNV